MSKHTPGPWNIIDGAVYMDNAVVVQHAAEYGKRVPVEERNANARLIAAAPELLEALRALLSVVEFAIDRNDGDMFGIRHNDAMDAIGEAESAIAKATAD